MGVESMPLPHTKSCGFTSPSDPPSEVGCAKCPIPTQAARLRGVGGRGGGRFLRAIPSFDSRAGAVNSVPEPGLLMRRGKEGEHLNNHRALLALWVLCSPAAAVSCAKP